MVKELEKKDDKVNDQKMFLKIEKEYNDMIEFAGPIQKLEWELKS
mgnify:CR=1 FL=1